MRVLRSLGGTWEQWEDQLTVDRFNAIIKAEEDLPPVYVTAYLVALRLGVPIDKVWGANKDKPKAKQSEVESNSGIGAFLGDFGMSGTLHGGM